MHDGGLFVYALRLTADPPDPTAIKVAMFTLAGVVVSTLGTMVVALRSPREERGKPHTSPQGGEDQVYRDLDERADMAEAELTSSRGRVAVLERFLWLQRFDPRKILTGDELPDDVRI